MKFFSYFLNVVIITSNVVASLNHSPLRPLKVVSGHGSANFIYQQIRKTKGESYPEPSADLDEAKKQKMCESILGNIFFANQKKYPYHKTLLDKLPGRVEPEAGVSYENIVVDVGFYAKSAENTIEESVFVCQCQIPVLGGLATALVKYYVSNEYNISEKTGSYIAGRFFFVEDARYERILLSGVAEEAARTTLGPGYELEICYMERKENKELATSVFEDPLCQSWLDVKTRICTAVFNSTHFRDLELSFVRSSVDGSCEKKPVSFKNVDAKADAGENQPYEEWVMHCEPVQNDGLPFNYFLSYAYENEEVFVYFWDKWEEKLYLENLTTNVRLRDYDFIYRNYF